MDFSHKTDNHIHRAVTILSFSKVQKINISGGRYDIYSKSTPSLDKKRGFGFAGSVAAYKLSVLQGGHSQ